VSAPGDTSVPAVLVRAAGLTLGGSTVLSGLDLEIAPGERVAVLGRSGAGKTSLLSLLNGSRPPSSGHVHVLGHDLARTHGRRRRALQRRIGTVHQHLHLVPSLKVVHNVNAGRLGHWSLWRSAWSLLAPRDTAQAARVLADLGVADRLGEPTAALSGGQQQRVAVARTLVQEPDLLLADEPVASLDRASGRRVVDRMLGLHRRRGTTLVVGLHDLDLALGCFDRVLALEAGRIVLDRPCGDVVPDVLRDLVGGAAAAAT
jgi:phosphonate transport system ATP-binding protein